MTTHYSAHSELENERTHTHPPSRMHCVWSTEHLSLRGRDGALSVMKTYFRVSADATDEDYTTV